VTFTICEVIAKYALSLKYKQVRALVRDDIGNEESIAG